MAGDVRQFLELIFVLSCVITVYSKDMQLNTDIFGALGDLAKKLQIDNCEFICPAGKEAYPNRNHVAKSNGCGSYGVQLDTSAVPDIEKCCDKHDLCYDTCGSKKKKCDSDFEKCLFQMCQSRYDEGKMKKNEYDGCKTAATLLHGGAMALGCHTFKESQNEACVCRRPEL